MYYKIVKQTLNNGLKVGFIDYPTGNICCVHIRGKVGSNYETTENIGSSHLLEHILLDSLIPNKLTCNGSKVVGITSRDDVIFGFKILNNNINEVINFTDQLLRNRIVIPDNIDSYKNIVNSEIFRHKNTPEKYITRLIYKSLFPKDRISIFNTGDSSHIAHLTTAHLVDFYKQNYSPNNFVVFVVGNLNNNIRHKVIQTLSTIPSEGKAGNKIVKLNRNNNCTVQVEDISGLPGCLVKVNYFGYTINESDKYPLLLLSEAINQLIRYTNTYKIACSCFSTASYGFLDISCGLTSKDWQKYSEELVNIVENIKINSRLFKQLKTRLVTRFLLSLDKMTSLTDYYSELLLFGNEDLDIKYEINAIKNTKLEDMVRVKKSITDQSPKITVLV